ncbi:MULTISPECIES: hypothetical protein [Microbacterium]|uniref:hypothetical protein n=1 Tax=Microbacterium TaxID=33882 RepID=UPI00197CAC7C|nr:MULTISPECIES: hypothetical protein [Microbacterium]MCK6067535.1 hypothetical protein [Microbacterium sp. EYE_512]
MDTERPATAREVLAGGMANAGAVIRRGAVVERPGDTASTALRSPCPSPTPVASS